MTREASKPAFRVQSGFLEEVPGALAKPMALREGSRGKRKKSPKGQRALWAPAIP